MARKARTRTHPDLARPIAAVGGEARERTAVRQQRAAGRPGRLAVVATPIGNLGDLSPRAAETLATAGLVLCEDTRVTSKLLRHLGLRRSLLAYHDHNAAEVRPRVLDALAAGTDVALVSDAGTPTVSDPGYRLVQEAAARGIEVVAVPGPSALLAALSVAGLPTDRFLFAGFLPTKTVARRAALAELRRVRATIVLYESPARLADCLADAAALLGPRPAAIARELTKRFEEVRRGTLEALASAIAAGAPPKGEIVLVIGPPDEATEMLDDTAVDAALAERLETCAPSAAAAAVAELSGRPRRELYRRALALRAAKP